MFPLVLARAGEFIEGLFKGEPVAWICLVVGIALSCVSYWVRNHLFRPSAPDVYRPPLDRPDFQQFTNQYGPPNQQYGQPPYGQPPHGQPGNPRAEG